MKFVKFINASPSEQNALDIFAGRWAAPTIVKDPRLELASFFNGDARPAEAAQAFGTSGRLDGMSVLELGPLEAAHTYRLEQMGADVTAIEGNAEAYLKCLVIKELFQLQSRFRLGSFTAFLEQDKTHYDMIFASGVLYHMPDPIRLLKQIADHADKAYVWTHYFDPADGQRRQPAPVRVEGMDATYYRRPNRGRRTNKRWWGGLEDTACWMARDQILSACRQVGFTHVDVVTETPPGGGTLANFSFVCSR